MTEEVKLDVHPTTPITEEQTPLIKQNEAFFTLTKIINNSLIESDSNFKRINPNILYNLSLRMKIEPEKVFDWIVSECMKHYKKNNKPKKDK